MSNEDVVRADDATPRYIERLLALRNGVCLVTVRGKRIVRLAPCRVPFLPPVVEATTNRTEHFLHEMLQVRAGTFVVHLASGAIVGLGTVEQPLEIRNG